MSELLATNDWRPPPPSRAAVKQGFLPRLLGLADRDGFKLELWSTAFQAGIAGLTREALHKIATSHKVSSPAPDVVDLLTDWTKGTDLAALGAARNALMRFAQIAEVGDACAGLLTGRGKELFGCWLHETVLQTALKRRISQSDLTATSQSLGLTQDESDAVYQTEAQKFLNASLRTTLQDGEFSPEDEASIKALAANLQVRSAFDAEHAELIADGRTAWMIARSDLPAIAVPVNLQKGEVAHRSIQATSWQPATRSVSMGSSGVTTSVRLMKGVYYRTSSMRSNRVVQTYEKQTGEGTLIITNKRLLFVSSGTSSSPKLNSILTVEPYIDAVIVTRGAGKPTTYRFANNDKWFAAMLSRAIVDDHR